MVASVVDKNMTIEELMTVPESDLWTYSNLTDGPVGYSASTFVVAFYRAAGLFDPKI